jgi:1-acyl-sn-glycerol-3-phosphate acyltransferase
MPTYEEELLRFKPWIDRIVGGALLGKRIVARGVEHIPREGPVILLSNHCGAMKDPSVVYRIAPRPLFFNVNRMLFNRDELDFLIRKHLCRHMGGFGLALDRLLGPLKALFVRFASSNIARFGAIPVDMYDQSKRAAVERFLEYLRAGKAIVSMQGRGRVHPDERNPYVKAFGRGVPYIAYRLRDEDGVDVPIVPIAIFGTHLPWGLPGRIRVNIGPPLYVRDHLAGTLDETVERFRRVLQSTVEGFLLEIIRGKRDR